MLGQTSHLVNAEVFLKREFLVFFLVFFLLFLNVITYLINVFITHVAKELFLLPKFFFHCNLLLTLFKQFLFQNSPLHKNAPLTMLYLLYTCNCVLYLQQAAHKLYSSSFYTLSFSFQGKVNLLLLLAISRSLLWHSILLNSALLRSHSSPK